VHSERDAPEFIRGRTSQEYDYDVEVSKDSKDSREIADKISEILKRL